MNEAETISKLAENILCAVDYDIYKEDLEEREILGEIEALLYQFFLEVK